MESLWLQICDIQGRLFKLAWNQVTTAKIL